VNDKRIECLWLREGLKERMKQTKKERLWLNPSWNIAAQRSVGQ
jgi:hypothetical protein